MAVAISLTTTENLLLAQGSAQDTTNKKGTTQMPMNMPMAKKIQKKQGTTAARTKKAGVKKQPAARKSTSRSANKRPSAAKSGAMTMPMNPESKLAPTKIGQMKMPDSAHKLPGDSAHQEMGRMKMLPSPGMIDSSSRPAMPAMHGMPAMGMPNQPTNSTPVVPMSGMGADDMMIGPAGVSMERMGSGTTWIPDAVSIPSRRRMLHDWMLMAHGFVFAQYDKQSGERGDDQFGSLNWGMLMATHDLAGGRFQARTMLSLDPLTVTNRGYPLLLQSGESYRGEPLFDRQHPHDFLMEVAALYQHEITKGLAWSIYVAPSGEPALGPVAFMHRPSAMDNPTAPLGHHWQDATHVSFGVVTGGIYSRKWQLESSWFNSRDPDEDRWDIDPIKLDSYSGRLTLNPDSQWSIMGGYGFVKSHDALAPQESMHRRTASVLYGARLGVDGQWASSFVWGSNKHNTEIRWTNAFLLESEAILDRHNTLFGRAEVLKKGADDLVVDGPVVTKDGTVLPGFPPLQKFNVGAVELGYVRELARMHWATVGLGGAGTVNFIPASLEPYYGSRHPVGTFIFLRVRPFYSGKPAVHKDDMSGTQMERDHE